jgi:hypothetical protein
VLGKKVWALPLSVEEPVIQSIVYDEETDAMMINARRTLTESCLPRRTICCRFCPSTSVNRRARTGPAIHDLTLNNDHVVLEREADPHHRHGRYPACHQPDERSWSPH